MTSIVQVIQEIKDFNLYQEVLDQILLLENNISSKLLTLELLTNTINDLIEKFLISKFSKISSFFNEYLSQKYSKPKHRQKFSFTLILSLIYFKDYYYYIGIK